MHQDQRIGLALGVLLVGACAAFFFRNETRAVPDTPRLLHAQQLDDRIAERSTRPYLKGIEAVEASDRRRLRTNADQGTSTWSPLDPPSGKNSNENSPRERKPRGKLPNDDSDVQELAPITISNDRLPANFVHGDESSDGIADRSAQKKNGATADERTYVVQKGETLISIATKTLGNPNRFHELFVANQDQLNDPNDLKLGMILRIPQSRSESASKPNLSRARVTVDNDTPSAIQAPTGTDASNDFTPSTFETDSRSTRNNSQAKPSMTTSPDRRTESQAESLDDSSQTEDSDGPRRFIPARRMPPPTRPAGPQARSNAPLPTGGRRLSQVFSESSSTKIAR